LGFFIDSIFPTAL